jgi:hypothetical protein
MTDAGVRPTAWPELSYPAWRDTAVTLQLWIQIVGKVRLALTPWLNHGWHVPLYVTARGLGTSAIHTARGSFEIEFDLVAHRLVVRTAETVDGGFALEPMSVAAFHRRCMQALDAVGHPVTIDPMPNEVPDPIRFADDEVHASYDAAAVHSLWRALLRIDRVFQLFRTGFLGKSSPVHLFWGSFDLAVTRFSGRPAPRHPGGVPGLPDAVTREAYSHEVSSAGFWPAAMHIRKPPSTRMPIRCRRASMRRRSNPPARLGRRRWVSGCCPTRLSGARATRTRRCCASSRPRTGPPRTAGAGMPGWSASSASRAGRVRWPERPSGTAAAHGVRRVRQLGPTPGCGRRRLRRCEGLRHHG